MKTHKIKRRLSNYLFDSIYERYAAFLSTNLVYKLSAELSINNGNISSYWIEYCKQKWQTHNPSSDSKYGTQSSGGGWPLTILSGRSFPLLKRCLLATWSWKGRSTPQSPGTSTTGSGGAPPPDRASTRWWGIWTPSTPPWTVGRVGVGDQCQWELCRTLQRSGDLLKEQLQGSLASQVHHPEGIMSSSPKHPTTESPRKISSWSRTKSCVKVVSAVISWIVRIKSLDTFWTRKMWVFIYHCVYILLHNLVWFYPFLKILDSILMRMNWGWSQNIYFLL